MKKCPFCAEEIQEDAIKCKHCSSDLLFAGATNNSVDRTSDGMDGKIKVLTCQQCGGEMVRKKISGDITSSCVLLLLGLVITIFAGVIGGIITTIGLIMCIVKGLSSRRYWICKKCSYKVERW